MQEEQMLNMAQKQQKVIVPVLTLPKLANTKLGYLPLRK